MKNFGIKKYTMDPLRDSIPVSRVLEDIAGVRINRGTFTCWLHPDKRPSGRVTKDNFRWKCFSCGNGGSIYDVVMLTMNLTFTQAKKYLYQHYGFVEPDFNTQEAREALERKRKEREQREEFQRRVSMVYELLAAVFRIINNRLQSHEDYLYYGSMESTAQAIEPILDELMSNEIEQQQAALDLVAGWAA